MRRLAIAILLFDLLLAATATAQEGSAEAHTGGTLRVHIVGLRSDDGFVGCLIYRSAEGFPGEHHFYLSFRTAAEGVVVPSFLRDRYPEEITIVLQNQFWDLEVDEDG